MPFDVSSLMFLGGVALIVALVQLVKSFVADSKWYPVFAVVFGLAINVGIGMQQGIDLTTSLFMGLIAGLSAAGIYSGVKALLVARQVKK